MTIEHVMARRRARRFRSHARQAFMYAVLAGVLASFCHKTAGLLAVSSPHWSTAFGCSAWMLVAMGGMWMRDAMRFYRLYRGWWNFRQ